MEKASLLRSLKSEFEHLSPQLREAARWVIDNPDDVALLTAREQARRAGVNVATLTRLAQHFGLSGYDDVRHLHADAVRLRPETFHGRAEELLERRDAEGDGALVQDIFAALAKHLQALSAPGSVAQFQAAADRLANAKRVYCLGLRSSFSVAFIFHYVQSLFGSDSVLVDSAGGFGMDALRHIGKDDALLAITVKPYTRATVEAARYALERGAAVIAVTDSELSPLADSAGDVLIVRTESPSFFHTMAPAFAAVECLAALVAARRGPQTIAALASSEEQLAAFDTYVLPRQKERKRR
jgi:DNA-binding MurR/RpiR family transcriptional regulator